MVCDLKLIANYQALPGCLKDFFFFSFLVNKH